MKEIKKPVVTINGKIDSEKRLSKPLPLEPLSPVLDNLIIDDISRNHLFELLDNWLDDLNIPFKPWSDVLRKVAIDLLEKSLKMGQQSFKTKENLIYLQTISTNAPLESKFLTNVYHGTTVDDEKYSIQLPIGGTIRIYGVNDDKFTESLFKLVKSLVYLINSLYLEIFVMRDSHVQLIMESTATKFFSIQQQVKSMTISKPTSNHNSDEKGSTHLLGWLKRLTPHITTSDSQPKRTKLSLRRGLSMTNVNHKSNGSDKQHRSDVMAYEYQHGDPHRFSKLKRRIEKALISSSPNCYFPYPTLLNRLEVEENIISEQKRALITASKDNSLLKTSSNDSASSQKQRTSFISSFAYPIKRRNSSHSDHSAAIDVQLPQSATAYFSVRVPELLADGKKGLEHLLLDTSSLEGFRQHQNITIGFMCYPIGCPDRLCLGPIMSKMDYFRFKSPSNTVTIYPRIDQSLGDTIRHWYNQSQSSCQLHIDEQAQFIPGSLVETPATIIVASKEFTTLDKSRPSTPASEQLKSSESSLLTLTTPYYSRSTPLIRHCSTFHGCNQLLLNHVFCFTHGIARIHVYTNTQNACAIENKDKIITCITCSICDTTTAPTLLSEQAASYSFAKFLELIFYSSRLAAPKQFCEHTKSTNSDMKSTLIRCFSYNGINFKFMYEEAKYYDLRLPRLQMGTPAAENISFTASRMSSSTLKEWKHTSAEKDIDLFFQTIRTHLDLLGHYTMAENRRKIRAVAQDLLAVKQIQSEQKLLDQEIKSLNKRLDADHSAMMATLSDTHINELNDFRRHFAIQSDTILEYLVNWQLTYCEEVEDTCAWDKPDYIHSKTIHCFPGSSVLVREDEPTSIIAYTLSSNDYIQELLLEDGVEYNDSASNTKTISLPSLSSADETVESSKTVEATVPVPPNVNKPLPTPSPSPSSIIDGYYSSIERKYISPSTGATSETASFRTMITEVVKSSVAEVSIGHTVKSRLSPWTRKQEEAKLENAEGDLKRRLTERTLQPLNAVIDQEETKEVKMSSYFYDSEEYANKTSKNSKSPHIKHKFVHEGVEFTCIVYYAKEFEMLRRQCDINQLIIESLSRCKTWTATGGKSKSTFYKTQDDRFIIKEMVNAWNVAEKDAFLKFAPKYFDHIKKSVNEPSILAKIFGFFTIRMKSVVDRKSLLNLDVLVMEHLFFNQNIIKRFDFKGLQDRQIEEHRKQQSDATLWDKDWLNEYRTKLPVYEQSKALMELAIANDTMFLSKCNIMDYSLLVGVDQSKREMTIGIVDFIGAYTWYKKIESRSKSTLQPRKEVTVLPPEQYRLRFIREVCDYFIPVPGKFDLVDSSKTLPSLLI